MHESIYDPNDKGPQRFGPRRLFKGGGSQTSTQEIPDELKPLASAYASRAMEVGNTPFQAYGGQRFAGLNSTQNAGIDMISQRAQDGSPIMDQANSTLTDFLQGNKQNPYLDGLVSKAQGSVVDSYNQVARPQQTSSMVNSGSFGNSGLEQSQQFQDKQLQGQLGDIATSMYGNAYNTDRANQLSALSQAPTFGNQAYTDAAQLLNAGGLQQQNQQNQADFNYQQFQDQQNQPYKNLQTLGAPFTGVSFGGTTKTSGGGK